MIPKQGTILETLYGRRFKVKSVSKRKGGDHVYTIEPMRREYTWKDADGNRKTSESPDAVINLSQLRKTFYF